VNEILCKLLKMSVSASARLLEYALSESVA